LGTGGMYGGEGGRDIAHGCQGFGWAVAEGRRARDDWWHLGLLIYLDEREERLGRA
jgi:hypothetical protein